MYEVSGTRLRTVPGSKFAGDVRLEMWTPSGWFPVKMELAFFLADFFSENEQARKQSVSFWRENGDTYFLRRLMRAVREGWKVVADEVERQRQRIAR